MSLRVRVVGVAVVAFAACGRGRFDVLPDGAAGPSDSDGVDTAVDTVCGYTFCDDFERDPPIEGGWDSATNSGLAVRSIDMGEYLLELPGTSLESAFLEKQLPLTTSSVTVRMQLSYASIDPGTAEIDLVQLQWLTLPGTCTSFGYFLVRDGTVPFNLQETYGGCGGNEQNLMTALDNTGLHSVEMTVTFGPVGTARIKLLLDGATRVDKATSHAIDASMLRLRVGGGAVRNVVAPWNIRFDDIFVDTQ